MTEHSKLDNDIRFERQRDGAWLLDKPPLMPEQAFDTHEEWEARIAQARIRFGRS